MIYKIIKERAEISPREYQKMGFIDAYTINGVMNGVYDVVSEHSNLDEALRELKEYRISPKKNRGWANVAFIEADVYLIAEYDDDEETWTGEMWFADEDEDDEEE